MSRINHWNSTFITSIIIYKITLHISIGYTVNASTLLKPLINQNSIPDAIRPLQEQYIYVDKTRFVLELLRDAQERYFLARPRRFGKTVFLRTLEAIFQGRREIFKGTDIYNDQGYTWEKYPILYFDLSEGSMEDAITLQLEMFKSAQNILKIPKPCVSKRNKEIPPEIRNLRSVLCTAAEYGRRQKVVILIDEYDHGLLKNSNNPKALKSTTHFLITLFTIIKSSANRIKLAFVTGVTRCSFAVVGSPAGDLMDISLNVKYGELAGVTKVELDKYFGDHIRELAEERNMSVIDIEKEIKDWYDGYAFTMKMESLYNPMSLHRYFLNRRAGVYWADHGRATYIWDQVRRRPEDFSNVRNGMLSKLHASGHVNDVEPEVLMYEAGYLTISDNNTKSNLHTLRFPNHEVENAFHEDLIQNSMNMEKKNIKPDIKIMKTAFMLPVPDFNTFVMAIDTAIMKLPFRFENKNGYHQSIYYLMRECKLNPIPEYTVRGARIDLVAESPYTIMHMELKQKQQGMKNVWDQATRSTRHFIALHKNILTAAVLLDTYRSNDTVLAGWKATLYESDGLHVIKNYTHENSISFQKYSYRNKPTKSPRSCN